MPTSTDGQWENLQQTPGDSRITGDANGVFVIHAVLLHTGNVLWFSGHAETINYLAEAYIWDPTQPTSSAVKASFPNNVDIFCCYHVHLEDGRILTAGGAMAHPNHGQGIKDICIFDPSTNTWERIGEMSEGRWYPTLVVLSDGRIVAFSGRTETNAPTEIAETVELFDPPFTGPNYQTKTLAGGNKPLPTYPGMHLVPGGRIFYTGTNWRYEYNATTPLNTFSFHVNSPTTGVWTDHGIQPNIEEREEGTSVLLPPAQDGRILLVGGGYANVDGAGNYLGHKTGSDLKSAEILDTQASPPAWTRIDDMTHPRVNVSAVLLPDGKVLVLGGHDSYKWDSGLTESNQAELYDPVTDSWTAVASMGAPRQYHSAALLLKDGRVVVAGGVDPKNVEPDTLNMALNQKTLEFYKPPYFFNGTRPQISSVSRDDGPNDTISYGKLFTINTNQAADIRKVVLMRPGAMTHHTDSEQRYVPLTFVQRGPTSLQAMAVHDPSVAPPGFYMLWIVDKNNLPCEETIFVRLTRQQCRIVTDKSHFSKDELNVTGNTTFASSFYVIMDGFLPSELGITTASPTQTQLNSLAPSITFQRGANTVTEITSVPRTLHAEDPALPPGVRQRFTFEYDITFSSDSVFFLADGTTPIETQAIALSATKASYSCSSEVTLNHQPNPFMLDGETRWLSVDVRVFQIREGESRFDNIVGSGSTAPNTFIKNVLNRFNTNATTGATEFASIKTDQTESKLELARIRGGKRVYNFAVAQVRYRGQTLDAVDVRVFFRMFTTAATGLDYRSTTTYRTSTNPDGHPISTVGMQGGEIVTIPFYAEPRINSTLQSLDEQLDPQNVRSLSAGSGESTTYFGCWLDFNQTALRYPLYPGGDGPYVSGLKSIQELIRGRHQCLVAEINFASDPIPTGATPGNNDNLSQRNLMIVESDNPGSAETHMVQHTFEIKPSPNIDQPTQFTATMVAFQSDIDLEYDEAVIPHRPPRGLRLRELDQDELMIRWCNLPHDTEVTIYLPNVGADTIIQLSEQRIGPPYRLQKVDDDTIRCFIGDVTYIPLPAGRVTSIPGLLTLRLPDNVKKGQMYRVIVSQISGVSRTILGAFEVFVNVTSANVIVAEEIRDFSVMQHILQAIPSDDRWYPVFHRYVNQMANRIRAFGDNPDRIAASPDGTGIQYDPATGVEHDPIRRFLCQWLPWATIILFASFTWSVTVESSGIVTQSLLAIFLLLSAASWLTRCRSAFCEILPAILLGFGVTAIGVGLLLSAEVASTSALTILILIVVIFVLLVIMAIGRRCFADNC